MDEIRVADLNQEMVQAFNRKPDSHYIQKQKLSYKRVYLNMQDQSTIDNITRVELAERLGLVKNGVSKDLVEVNLPQAFLIVS